MQKRINQKKERKEREFCTQENKEILNMSQAFHFMLVNSSQLASQQSKLSEIERKSMYTY